MLDQTRDRGRKAERGQVGGRCAPGKDGLTAVLDLQQCVQADMADHIADGKQEGQGHAAHQQHGKAAHHFGVLPDAGCEQQGEEEAGEQTGRRAVQQGREALLRQRIRR